MLASSLQYDDGSVFARLFQEFDCGCVIYAQPSSAVVVGEIFDKFYKISHNQLITQITNGETKEQFPWTHQLSVPIIANPDDQTQLFRKLENAFEKNPETNAVLIKGNGLLVCGDTWQETKAMFEALLKMFEISIQLRRVGAVGNNSSSSVTKSVTTRSAPASKTVQDDVQVIEEKAPKKAGVAAKPNSTSRPTSDRRGAAAPFGRGGASGPGRARDELALKRKKLALARLRMTAESGRGERRTAASFMGPASRAGNMGVLSQGGGMNIRGMNNIDMGMNQNMNMGMNNMGMNNMEINNMEINNMGMNNMEINNMGMNMNMMMNNQGNMGMGMFNSGMMGMGNPGVMLGPDMFQSGFDGEVSQDARAKLSRPPGTGRVRGRGAARRAGPLPDRGNVQDRLGFKSSISVDPALLEQPGTELNEEDY